jgi:Holliday junction resolvase RusA-like endonuclease
MRPPLTFFCAGKPQPAGSKRGFFIAKIKRVVIVDANKNAGDWKTDVKYEAQSNYSGDLWDGPICLRLTFFVIRPNGHYRSGKNAHLLRDSAPRRPTGKPDLLKLARGVEDALTGIIWKDDAQICEEYLRKEYGSHPGCRIEIKECETE